MRKLLNQLKKIVPMPIWLFFRSMYYGVIDFVKMIGPKIKKINYCGLVLFYNKGNNIIFRLKNEPIFEEKMCQMIVDSIQNKENPVFVDVGVNIGFISAYVLSKINNIKIFAFEPGPKQREVLEMTIEHNNLKEKMVVYADALGKEVGKAVFQTHDPRYVAGDGFLDTGRAKGARSIDVNVTTLDNWWESQNSPKIDVIKIDTEGAELWILQGAVNVLAGASPVLFLEVEPRNLKVYPYNHLDILDFLTNQNYQLFTLDNEEVTKENFDNYLGTEDTYIARPVKKSA